MSDFMRDAIMSAQFMSREDRRAYLAAMQREANKEDEARRHYADMARNGYRADPWERD